ncbi:MAG: hypothetical protein ACRD0L_16715 [Acidimicrobiales bacterium]
MDARQVLAQVRADPELADEVRRALLTDELLGLPGLIAELAERQGATEARIAELAEKLSELVERMARVQTQVFFMGEALTKLTGTVADMRGDLLELRYSRHSPAYFAPLLRRPAPLQPDALTTLVEDGREAGMVSDSEARDLLFADLVLQGLDRESREPVRMVVEVSGFLERHDVERAHRRAGLLARVAPDQPVRAAVAGETIEASVPDLAADRGVAILLDGRRASPES